MPQGVSPLEINNVEVSAKMRCIGLPSRLSYGYEVVQAQWFHSRDVPQYIDEPCRHTLNPFGENSERHFTVFPGCQRMLAISGYIVHYGKWLHNDGKIMDKIVMGVRSTHQQQAKLMTCALCELWFLEEVKGKGSRTA